jgi:hypothetical protein
MLCRILLLVVLLLGGIGTSFAATFSNQQLAYAACADAGANSVHPNKLGPWRCNVLSGSTPTNGQYVCEFQVTSGWSACTAGTYWIWSGGCPAGTVWNESTKTCFNPQQCLARNSEPGFANVGPTVRNFRSACIAGCKFAMTSNQMQVVTDGQYTGVYEFTGDMCGLPAVDKPVTDTEGKNPNPQECQTYPSGQKFCQKANGEQCYTTTNGRQNCWRPGETGEKNDGPTKQKRNAGPTEIPPENLQLPSGDSLQKQGESITKTTTITKNSSTTTNTTTTTNYQTVNGTNAGETNEGESDSGDGSGKEGEEEGTASGGGNCESPPVVSGDQVLGMVATQAWHTRCAVEAGNAAKVTGDVANCAEPFTVEGDNANAVKLRAMRSQLCKGDANNDGQPDWTQADTDYDGDAGAGDEEPTSMLQLGIEMLDDTGFGGGGGNCPSLGMLDFGPFGTFDLDSEPFWCQLVSILAVIIPLFGAFAAIRILME